MSHIKPWGVGPGGPAVLGEAPGYASAPGRYQLECEPFFGPPPGEILPGPRDQPREMWGTPDAYRNQRLPYVANTIIRLLTQFQNSWVTSRVLPLKEQQDLKIAWTVIEFDRTLAEFEPELGVPRLATLRRRQEGAYMTRHGMALEVNHGYASTPQGRDDWMLKIRSITGAVQETMDQAGIMALVQAADFYYKSVMRKISSYPTLLGAYDESCKTFGGVQFRPRFWHEMHTDGEMMMSLENVIPDTWIVPLGLQTWASISDSLEVNADKAGSAVARHNIENGYKAFLNFRGCTVHGARPVTLDQDGRTIEPLVRNRTIGKCGVVPYYRLKEIVPGGAVCPVHADGRVQLFIPAEDDWHTFTWLDVYRQSNVAGNQHILNSILRYGEDAHMCMPSEDHVGGGRAVVPGRSERPSLVASRTDRLPVPSRAARKAEVPRFVSKAMQMAIERHEGVDFTDSAAAAAGWASKFAKEMKCSDDAARVMHKRNLDRELVNQLHTHHDLSRSDLDAIQEQIGDSDAGVEEAATHLFNAYLRGDGKSNPLYRNVLRNSSGKRDRASLEAMHALVLGFYERAREEYLAGLVAAGAGLVGHVKRTFDDEYQDAYVRVSAAMDRENDDIAMVFAALRVNAADAAVGHAAMQQVTADAGVLFNAYIAQHGLDETHLRLDRVPPAVVLSPLQDQEVRDEIGAGNMYQTLIMHTAGTMYQNRSIDQGRVHAAALAAAVPANPPPGIPHAATTAAMILARWFSVNVDPREAAGGMLNSVVGALNALGAIVTDAYYEEMVVGTVVIAQVCQWLRGIQVSWTDAFVDENVHAVVRRAVTELEPHIVNGYHLLTVDGHVEGLVAPMIGFASTFVDAYRFIKSDEARRARLQRAEVADLVADLVMHNIHPLYARMVAMMPPAAGGVVPAPVQAAYNKCDLISSVCAGFTIQMMFNIMRKMSHVHNELRRMGGPIVDHSLATGSGEEFALEPRVKDHERFPFDWWLVRTTEEYLMGTAILCKAGSTLGCSYYGHQDFMMSDDAQAKKHFGHFTIWTSPVIHDPSQLLKYHDVFCVRYVAGGGSQILPWDKQPALHQDIYAAFRDNHASILAIPVPIGAIDIEDNSWSMRNPIDLSNSLDTRFSAYLGENCEDRVDIGDYSNNVQNTFDAMYARWTYLPTDQRAKVSQPVVPDYPRIYGTTHEPGRAWSARVAKTFGFDNSNPMAAIAAADSDFHKSAFIRNTLVHMGGHRIFNDKKKVWDPALENTGHFGAANDRRGTLRLRNGHFGLATELNSGISVIGMAH
jgi:hypothetical protein